MKRPLIILITTICVAAYFYFLRPALVNLDLNAELPVLGNLKDFSLIDQDHSTVTLKNLKGSVVVTNFIFTNCPGPCPIMTAQMRSLQKDYSNNPKLKFISISIDPERDPPEVLTKYAARYQADTNQWYFLTGKKEDIIKVAENIFKVSSGKEDLDLHTTRFILTDPQGHIRAYHDSQSENFISEIKQDINLILK